jgi:hypothetical protein
MSKSTGTAQIREERDHGRAAAQAGPQAAMQLQVSLRAALAALRAAHLQARGLEDAFLANGYQPDPAFTAKLRAVATDVVGYAETVSHLI